jgi:hypothetical protein
MKYAIFGNIRAEIRKGEKPFDSIKRKLRLDFGADYVLIEEKYSIFKCLRIYTLAKYGENGDFRKLGRLHKIKVEKVKKVRFWL